jgi:hypothetical protein
MYNSGDFNEEGKSRGLLDPKALSSRKGVKDKQLVDNSLLINSSTQTTKYQTKSGVFTIVY